MQEFAHLIFSVDAGRKPAEVVRLPGSQMRGNLRRAQSRLWGTRSWQVNCS